MQSSLFPAVDHSEYKRSLYLECWNKLRMWEMTEWDRWASMAGLPEGGQEHAWSTGGRLQWGGSARELRACPLAKLCFQVSRAHTQFRCAAGLQRCAVGAAARI